MLIDVAPVQPLAAPELAIVHQVNRLRSAFGLGRVHVTRRLNRAARRHTLAMLRAGRLSHEVAGVTYMRRLESMRYALVGETLAFVPRSLHSDALTVVWEWLMSPGHREQLLEPSYWRIGVSRMTGTIGSDEGVAITVNFSTRK